MNGPPRALVVTTVHQAGDPRIFERTIPSLTPHFRVTYAAREPAPDRLGDIDWAPLAGGRVRRWWRALGMMLRSRYRVVSLHDPELIPAGLIAWLFGRRIVVDVHENVPAQIRDKSWVSRPLRPFLARVSHLLLRAAGRFLEVTLAEPGYRALFKDEHPVFPNYARAGTLPGPAVDEGYLVYVGDVTEGRGALAMVDAARGSGRPLRIVGRYPPNLADAIADRAATSGVPVQLTGNLPHAQAMSVAASAAVGLSLLRGDPNERNSMPTKVIEYLQVGIPVVASDLPGTRGELEGLQGVWLVPPGDVDAARSAIAQAVAIDRSLLAAQATRLKVERVWPAEDVLDFYRRVAGV